MAHLRELYEQYGYDQPEQIAKQVIADLQLEALEDYLFEPLYQHAMSWLLANRRQAEKDYIQADREYKDKRRTALSPLDIAKAEQKRKAKVTTLYGEYFNTGNRRVYYKDATVQDFEGAIAYTQSVHIKPLNDKIDFWKKCIRDIQDAGVTTWGQVPK